MGRGGAGTVISGQNGILSPISSAWHGFPRGLWGRVVGGCACIFQIPGLGGGPTFVAKCDPAAARETVVQFLEGYFYGRGEAEADFAEGGDDVEGGLWAGEEWRARGLGRAVAEPDFFELEMGGEGVDAAEEFGVFGGGNGAGVGFF